MHGNQASLNMISVVNKRLGVLMMAVASTMEATPVKATSVEITAEYFPDPARAMRNEFADTTVQSGFCADYSARCKSLSMVGFRLPYIFQNRANIGVLAPIRHGPMFSVPSHWQTISVVHESSGDSKEIQVRVAGIGTTYRLTEDVRKLVGYDDIAIAHGKLWEGGWGWGLSAPPCAPLFYPPQVDSLRHRSFWHVPLNVGTCAQRSNFEIPFRFTFEYLDIAFESSSPNPLEMTPGLYRGTFPLRFDHSGGFDVGDNMYLSVGNNLLDVNFTFKVGHTLKVEIPPGGNKIELAPQGGWQSWLMAGRRPTRLFRDQTFSIWASSKFKMHIECDSSVTYECAIKDPISKQVVELKVSVSLPNGLTDTAGQPVNYRRLTGTQYFQPGFYVNRAQGTLHFEVGREQMELMIRPDVASRYSGNVVVVWDSEV
jgi:hypothetical protein